MSAMGGSGERQLTMSGTRRISVHDGPHYSAAARRAYLVVPEIGVLKWFLGSSSIASVNLGSESRSRMLVAVCIR